MRSAIIATHDGDYFIVRKIKATERRLNLTCELGPIYISLRGRKNYESEIYAKVSWPERMNKKPVVTGNLIACAELVDSMDEGTLDFYQTTEIGFMREQFVYKDSQIVLESVFDDQGRIKTTKRSLPDDVWEYKFFYPNGKTWIHTFYRRGDVLLANDSFAACWDQAMANLNWSSSSLLKPEDCYEHKLEGDLYLTYAVLKIAPYYSFKSYYENGKIKSEGGLVRKQGKELKNMSWGCEVSKYYEFNNHTLMDGEWLFYNDDGILIKTINYDIGTQTK